MVVVVVGGGGGGVGAYYQNFVVYLLSPISESLDAHVPMHPGPLRQKLGPGPSHQAIARHQRNNKCVFLENSCSLAGGTCDLRTKK